MKKPPTKLNLGQLCVTQTAEQAMQKRSKGPKGLLLGTDQDTEEMERKALQELDVELELKRRGKRTAKTKQINSNSRRKSRRSWSGRSGRSRCSKSTKTIAKIWIASKQEVEQAEGLLNEIVEDQNKQAGAARPG